MNNSKIRILYLNKMSKSKGHKFQEAIATYGECTFKWEQIDTAENRNELASKEKEYIFGI